MVSCLHRNKLLIGGCIVVICLTILITVLVVTTRGKNDNLIDNFEGRRPYTPLRTYRKAAVSTHGVPCAAAGAEILKKAEASAVDGAIATLLCEGVVSLHSTGLGGGFHMIIWDPRNGGKADFLDAREVAPFAATETMFEGDANAAMYGGKAIAVPGELMGLWRAHQKYGKVAWAELFAPSIKVCNDGFVVNDYFARSWASKVDLIKKEPTLIEILIDPKTNLTWAAGDIVRRPLLAKTLEKLATAPNPIELFYKGTMGRALIAEIQEFGGIMTMDDLIKYDVKWKQPIVSDLGKFRLYTSPPPGSGVLIAFIAKVLQGLVHTADPTIFWHRLVETFKWAFAKRTQLADPDFENIDAVLAELASNSYINATREKIKKFWTSNDPKYYGVETVLPEDAGTAHVSVIARDGSAVAVTSTINQVFGAMRRSRSTGIIFNDEMDDFSSPNITNGFDLPPSPVNFIKPGKRPLSSMTPTIVVDDKNEVRLVIGAAGGTKISTAVVETLILNLWNDYDLKAAIEARRIHHQVMPMTLYYEPGFDDDVLNRLRGIGHKAAPYAGIGSAVNGLARSSNGNITANADYRRQGSTGGY